MPIYEATPTGARIVTWKRSETRSGASEATRPFALSVDMPALFMRFGGRPDDASGMSRIEKETRPNRYDAGDSLSARVSREFRSHMIDFIQLRP